MKKNKEKAAKKVDKIEKKRPKTASEFKDQLRILERELESFGVGEVKQPRKKPTDDENALQVIKPGEGAKNGLLPTVQGIKKLKSKKKKISTSKSKRKNKKMEKALNYRDKAANTEVKKWQQKIHRISY